MDPQVGRDRVRGEDLPHGAVGSLVLDVGFAGVEAEVEVSASLADATDEGSGGRPGRDADPCFQGPAAL